jgi:hypothetical protein
MKTGCNIKTINANKIEVISLNYLGTSIQRIPAQDKK